MARTLTDEDLDAIAERVAARLSGTAVVQATSSEGHLSVSQVAQRLGVHPSYVYANARALGGYRLSDAPRSRWRFDPALLPGRKEVDSPRREPRAPGRRRATSRSPGRRPVGRRYVPPIPLEE